MQVDWLQNPLQVLEMNARLFLRVFRRFNFVKQTDKVLLFGDVVALVGFSGRRTEYGIVFS